MVSRVLMIPFLLFVGVICGYFLKFNGWLLALIGVVVGGAAVIADVILAKHKRRRLEKSDDRS